MKTLRLLLLSAACAGVCAAQESPPASPPPPASPHRAVPPGVAVVKLKWERQLELAHERGKTVLESGRPDGAPEPLSNPGGMMVRGRSPFPREGESPYVYQYSAEIRNDGERKIDAVVWEYVVGDPDSGKELGRHRFASSEDIGARKTKTLRGRSRLSPSRTVSAAALGKGGGQSYDERVEFRCVFYADGARWRHPSAGESECAFRKRQR